jgi:hypothetical protein
MASSVTVTSAAAALAIIAAAGLAYLLTQPVNNGIFGLFTSPAPLTSPLPTPIISPTAELPQPTETPTPAVAAVSTTATTGVGEFFLTLLIVSTLSGGFALTKLARGYHH